MRERRVARAQDHVAAKVDAELLLQRGLDVDLGEDPEAFLLQGSRDLLQRLLEARLLQAAFEPVSHLGHLSPSCYGVRLAVVAVPMNQDYDRAAWA